MTLQATRDDKFSFGLWTVGWNGADPFGGPTRAPLDTVHVVEKLAEIGAYGLTFTTTTSSRSARRTRSARPRSTASSRCSPTPGSSSRWRRPNLFSQPVFKDGGFTNNDRAVRRFAIRKVLRNLELAVELGAKTYVMWGGREGAEYDSAKDIRLALDRYKEAVDFLGDHVLSRAGTSASRSSRSRTSRAATSCCRRSATRSPSSTSSSTRSSSASTPRWATSRWPASTSRPGSHRRSGTASSSTSTSTASAASSSTRTLVFGHGDLHNAFALVDLLENGGPNGGRAYEGPRHFDYKPSRTEDETGVWESAKANIRTYLLLKERAKAFRADPEVQEALAAAKLDVLGQPTLNPGETVAQLVADRSAWEDFDPKPYFNGKGSGFVRLQQLATEHLLGAR